MTSPDTGSRYGAITREWHLLSTVDDGRDASFQASHRGVPRKTTYRIMVSAGPRSVADDHSFTDASLGFITESGTDRPAP
ncbi:hypothetical protein BSP239C_03873 [Brevibacterium sp. 239c]|nr:hypothetical protein BSP239C_03873 [Brevibacterium sp. 239c]